MNCPKCKIPMRVRHTYKAGGAAHTGRHFCPKCRMVCTSVTFMLNEAPEKGEGAYSVAKKIGQKEVEDLRTTLSRSGI